MYSIARYQRDTFMERMALQDREMGMYNTISPTPDDDSDLDPETDR